MEFDVRDKKLIAYLYHNYREPFTKIAKVCKMSRDQVEYRIKKYEESGLIRKYITIFNYNLLGYNKFIIMWIKLKKDRQEIIKKLESMKNILSVGQEVTKYDLFVNMIFRDDKEFEQVFHDFVKKNKTSIKHYEIFITTSVYLFPLKEFEIKSKEEYNLFEGEKIKLDEKDMRLLKVLEKNGREKIVNISTKVNLSSELIIYKLKQFHKNKLILGTRIQFDMEKLGFHFATLKLNFNYLTEDLKKEIELFCKNHKHINALSFGLGSFNCIVQFFYKEDNALRKSIQEFNEKFKDNINFSELLLIEKEGRVKTLPI